jgi:small conductance mechanosensitive channel
MQLPAPAKAEAASAVFHIEAVAAIALAGLAAAAIAMLVGSLTRRLLRAIEGERVQTQPIAGTTVRVVRRVTFVLSLLVLTFPALDLFGVNLAVGLNRNEATRWLAENGARVLLIVLLAFAFNRFAASVIRRAEDEIADGDDFRAFERRKRAQTLGGTARRFFAILIWSAASLMVLRELDVDITPVLTGAGILGLAVGFGAQTLVKDIISGLFLIAEDQVRIGDSVVVNNVGGTVEEINLRTIVLRDVEGTVHTIANGDVRGLANKSRDYSYFVLDIGVPYDADTDRIVEVVKATAAGLMDDPEYRASILEPLEVMGLDAFRPSEVMLRFRIKTLPQRQSEVGRELRRRVKMAFDAAGIHISAPQLAIAIKKTDAI